MLVDYETLQNGSDIRGIAIAQCDRGVNLNPEVAKFISYGFIQLLENKLNMKAENLKVAVGMDSRLSGPTLKTAVINSFIDRGCKVYDCSMSTTPAMFMTTLETYNCDGAIMITASHLPYYYNGLKFFTREGGCEKEDIDYILSIASKEERYPSAHGGKCVKIDLINQYSNVLVDMIRKGVCYDEEYNTPLKKFKIAVDAGNGAGGFFADNVLKVLGADVSGSQFVKPNGMFSNHIPNPENDEAMDSIKNAVLSSNSDLGIIFDTDVDRVAIVDSSGMEINKNKLIALIAAIVLEEHPKSIIVTDSITSTGLSEFIKKLGGVHYRFKRGYRNIINEAKRLNNEGKECYLAIETSGHAALKENYFLDDGAYLVAKILIKMAKLNMRGKEIGDLIEDLKLPYESLEFRIDIKKNNFKKYGMNIINDLENYISLKNGFNIVKNNYEGIRVNCDKNNGDGWFLLRLSLHEPVLVLNIESNIKDGAKIILEQIRMFLEKYDGLNLMRK
ncbi:phosphomannomutase/phosphoglucomutase [Clostridium neonatale]|uniref:phosphomannomutase/phosphoglucomutase n=1 Tax=Clostridium neonatale TaxID=137838 RepID=UPI003D332689